MKASSVGKLGLLVGACVISSFTASQLMARKQQEAQDGPLPVLTKTKAANNARAGIPEGAIPVDSIADFKMSKMTVIGGVARFEVDAEADIQDSREGTLYMWSLAVTDPVESKILSRVDYKEQIFSVPARGVPVKESFRESVEFPPGTYNVAVRLYEVTGLQDVSVLEAENSVGAHILASDYKEVTVE